MLSAWGDGASLVGLEVPVHDAVVVDVLQGQHRLSEVHTGHLHGQRPNVLQQGGAVSSYQNTPCPSGGRTQTHTHTHTHTYTNTTTHTHTHPTPTFHVLHDHAEVASGLEGAEHGDHEGVLSEGQDVALHKGLLDLVPQDQVLLVNLLHGEALPRLQVAHQVHRAGGERERQ